MTRYADVILPLPIYGTYTYIIPETIGSDVMIGSRVLVPFGKSGCYTGIVEALHTSAPAQGVDTKEIILVLDTSSILRHPQLKLWRWMSEYYLCSPGEVMKAALPAALKVESENMVAVSPDAEGTDIQGLTGRQAEIFAYIAHEKRVRVSQIEKQFGSGAPRAALHALMEKGLVQISERLVDKYVTKTRTVVSLKCDRSSPEQLHACFDAVKRSPAQEKLLIALLDLSGWIKSGQPLHQVAKSELLEKTGTSAAALKGLCDKGIVSVEKVRVNRFSPAGGTYGAIQLPSLSAAQQQALRGIDKSMRTHTVTLLRGVTGSGKTEIYSHLIQAALSHGDHVLMLVPEISLTTQLTSRLSRIFGSRLLVYHSRFSDSERADIWRRVLSSREPQLILGVRSSVFLPFPRLGLIIVDEEHEASYKQFDPAPRYNARDTAIMLATMHGAKVLLGSATPAVETYYKARTGKYGLVELLERYGENVTLPQVKVVDMRDRRKKKEVTGPFSTDLLSAMRSTLQDDKQIIVFQNRRGFSPMMMCDVCGWTPKCPHCDVSLVHHKHTGELRCHYCGYSITIPSVCPACGSNALRSYGYGTERISDRLQDMFPDVPLQRMDLDTTRNKDAYHNIISAFSEKKTKILVGTQMISKGLDFNDVTLVGIVNADTMLNFPDFRSNERAFNMMEQVSGRAGRRSDPGLVVIQTTNPEHPAIRAVCSHDYIDYYNEELEQRRLFCYPPFSKIINITLRHKQEQPLIDLTVKYTMEMQRVFGTRVLGPQTPSVSRIGGYHIRTLMLKIELEASMVKVKALLRQIYLSLASLPGMSSLRLHYDVDPC